MKEPQHDVKVRYQLKIFLMHPSQELFRSLYFEESTFIHLFSVFSAPAGLQAGNGELQHQMRNARNDQTAEVLEPTDGCLVAQ